MDKIPARKLAETRHLRLRNEACRVVVNELKALYPHLQLSDIDTDAVAQARRWAEAPCATRRRRPYVPWDWQELWRRFRNHACRVDLAIRDAEVLCALAVGRVSKGRMVASIHYLQSNPASHDLQGEAGRIATAYLLALATQLRCGEIALNRPVPELVAYYERLGFTRHVHRKGMLCRLVQDITVGGQDLTVAVDGSSRLSAEPTRSGGQQ